MADSKFIPKERIMHLPMELHSFKVMSVATGNFAVRAAASHIGFAFSSELQNDVIRKKSVSIY